MKLRILTVFSCLFVLSCAKDNGFYKHELHQVRFEGNTYEYLKSKPGVYDSLVKVIDRVGLADALKTGDVTVFTPTNESFRLAIENLNSIRRRADKSPEFLSTIKYEHLDTMMSQYILDGRYTSDSLGQQDGRFFTDYRHGYQMHAKLRDSYSSGYIYGGPSVIEFTDPKRSQFVRNWVTTSTSSINIETNNGVVHALAPDHVFGFNDFVKRLTLIPPPTNLFFTVGGTFTASHEHSGGPNAVEASKYVFDGNPQTKFLISFPNTLWFQVELNEPTVANAYTLTSANDAQERDPIDWRLEGSHDGEAWTMLNSRSSEEFVDRFMQRVFRFNNTTAYTFYRLSVTRIRSGSTFQLADWSINYEELD
ncbi:discoidin domain-containing protein [Sphingobacterium gobiense]|uniref:ATP/GTP-binding protein n=1 Tax=Sphingobacterium gobiense TaxID=1382456 RepID=A0A2S9JSA0_9SPHI|nr:fasciclin domain-containing protein [Sphingobacterium gobiense]PRD56166.1 ATP/GTP-binding protein [Sphingobacterium gobiense]